MTKPISPDDAKEQAVSLIPGYVFEAFNSLILERAGHQSILITQDEVIERILMLCTDRTVTRHTLFKQGWLDVETAYEREGWNVEYDKPSYGDSYEAHFTFARKRK